MSGAHNVALYIHTTEPESAKPGKFSWDQWYQENKARLSEKRAKRYREDPDYRAAALRRSSRQRKKKPESITDGHTIAFRDMAEALGVTVCVLREWRRKNYFPEPYHREGRLWFTPHQQNLLQKLGKFFNTHGVRIGPSQRPALEERIALLYSNWE